MRDCPNREREVADPGVEREEDDRRVRQERPQLAGDLEAGLARHRVVEKDQVRLEFQRHAARLDAISGLANDEELVIRRKQRADALADREVVVGYENPCGHADSLGFGPLWGYRSQV